MLLQRSSFCNSNLKKIKGVSINHQFPPHWHKDPNECTISHPLFPCTSCETATTVPLQDSFIGHYVSASVLRSLAPQLPERARPRVLSPRKQQTHLVMQIRYRTRHFGAAISVFSSTLGSEVAIKTNPTSTSDVTSSDRKNRFFSTYLYSSDSGRSASPPNECEGNCSCGRGQMSALSR